MQEEQQPKALVSIACFILGVSLIGASFFVAGGDQAQRMFNDLIQLIMVVAGCLCIIVAIVAFFVRDTPDIWM